MSEDNTKTEIKLEHLLQKCRCDNVATWYYAPSGPGERYYCEDCVPRGCECNYRYVNVDAYFPPLDNPDLPTTEDEPYIWIEEGKIWCRVDEEGRQSPCAEYWYDEDGFEIYD